MILKRLGLVFIVLFSAFACSKLKGPEKPENLISKDKMVAILIDAKFISSASSKNKLIMRDSGLNVETYIYEKYNIDSLQFALSNSYYAFYIEDYADIYTRITDSLEVLQAELKEIESEEWKEKTKKEADSLKATYKNKDSLGISAKTLKEPIKIDDALSEESAVEIEDLIKPVSDSDFQ